jgi:hypothetical protein
VGLSRGGVVASVSEVRILLGLFKSEEENTMIFQNVGNHSLYETASHPRRPVFYTVMHLEKLRKTIKSLRMCFVLL